MAVKLRLTRKGRRKAPFYHIVAADARAPRDGKFIEKLGTYNPLTKPATVVLDTDRAYYWLTVGAQPTETVRSILRFKGVMYRKHLAGGVKKGALTQEAADAKYNEWIAQKEEKLAARREQEKKERNAWLDKLAGANYVPKPKEKPATLDEAVDATEEAVEAVAAAPAEAPAVEETTTTVNEGDKDPELAAAEEAPAKTEAPTDSEDAAGAAKDEEE